MLVIFFSWINSNIEENKISLVSFIFQKVFENKLIRLVSFKNNSKFFLIFCFFISFFTIDLLKAEENNLTSDNKEIITLEYLNPKEELEDYILGTGDRLYIEFFPAKELNNFYSISPEGELLLPRLDETYVRGLTITELKRLLEKKYSDYLIDPEITIRIVQFKKLRVLVEGAVRSPGIYKFPIYRTPFSLDIPSLDPENSASLDLKNQDEPDSLDNNLLTYENIKLNQASSDSLVVKRSNDSITTISDAIRQAGGITSKTDLSRITIIRDIPLAKGGGKEKSIS